MSRYINAEETKQIIQEKMTSVVEDADAGKIIKDAYLLAVKHATEWVDAVSAKEGIEVVRCKDCVYSEKTLSDECPKECSWCGKLCFVTHEKHYCSYGERKEG